MTVALAFVVDIVEPDVTVSIRSDIGSLKPTASLVYVLKAGTSRIDFNYISTKRYVCTNGNAGQWIVEKRVDINICNAVGDDNAGQRVTRKRCVTATPTTAVITAVMKIPK